MTNEFSKWYLALLRKQVDEEIQYLVTNGHDTRKIHIPCMFCIDTRKGHYTCYRLNQLREFHSTILSHEINTGIRRAERKQIGFENVIEALESPKVTTIDNDKLPIMFPALSPLN